MYYYHVWVKSTQYRGSEPLTYQHGARLPIGSIVRVELRHEAVAGIVTALTGHPDFTTKPISTVLDLPPLPKPTLQLAAWLQKFYPAPLGVITQQFLPNLTGKLDEEANPAIMPEVPTEPPLTNEQKRVLEAIDMPDTYLLHGRTGSGKTRVYTELTRRILKLNCSALILSPEIGLTSQLAARFRQLFGGQVVVLHSQLADKQRASVWLRILKSRDPLVIIGPRSALFAPISNLGLIVVDECHDPAFKQEQLPYYQGLRVASKLRTLHAAVLVLGSATPSVSDYYLATRKSKTILRLETLAVASRFERHVVVVDAKDRSLFSRTAHLSSVLIDAMASSITRHEQVLLYLNRRGTARVVLCDRCGWQAACPHCGLPLTYHGDAYRLRCHICGHDETVRPVCPTCGNTSIIFRGFGTKAIVDEARRLFPEARIARFDTDNKKSERLEHRYEQILAGDVDILVGTQMLAKGLDLPRLSTLGIVAADSSLALPDYTSTERTYQLISQVMGRIGRGHRESTAVIQTLHPQSTVLKAALGNDWDTFYNDELQQRRRYLLPPFCSILKLCCRRTTAVSAEKAAATLRHALLASHPGISVEGPAPAFRGKIGNKFQWQLLVKARDRGELLQVIGALPKTGWMYDLDPADLL